VGASIPIIADTPSPDPGLGFGAYADALASAIKDGTPAQFTVGIYGAWGSGKSSLLNALARRLSSETDVIPVLFDAWRYEAAGPIVIPLIHAIYAETSKVSGEKLAQKVRTALLSVARSLTISLGPVSISGDKIAGPPVNESQLDELFSKPYQDMRAISQALDGRRIAVLVDDLDRCSPDKVVSLLEAINLVMDVPGFVFVLALDYDVLVRAVTERYPHASGHVFIEKMVQVPFRVPRLVLPPEGFLGELIPDWLQRSRSLPGGFEEIAHDVATLGLEANPRQIKRFINSVMVLISIARDRDIPVDARILAGLVGVQLRWPAEYADLAQAILADDPDPVSIISPQDQPGLTAFSERFFAAGTSASTLWPYLQLTQAVAVAEAADIDGAAGSGAGESRPAAEVREVHKEELLETLRAQEYVERTPNVYTNSRNPSFRVKFAKTVIRLEVKFPDGRWHLATSFLLTREYAAAVALLADREKTVRELAKTVCTSSYFQGQVSYEWLRERNADVN
jgi:hypothetical protein